MSSKGEKIVGIKSIAVYLQVSERTISRWEKDLGLPLYRVHGENSHTVYAFQNELDEFVAAKNGSRTMKLPRKHIILIIPFIVFAFVVVVTFILWFLQLGVWPFGKTDSDTLGYNPQLAVRNNNFVEIRDADNKFLWSFPFESSWFDPTDSQHIAFRDIDADGKNEVFGIQYESIKKQHFFTLYDDSGEKIWQVSPALDQSFGGILLEGDYFISDFQLLTNDLDEPRAVVVWRHPTLFLSVIVSYDADGIEINKYYHPGAVDRFTYLESFGHYKNVMIFSGMNNLLYGEGCVFALARDNFYGVAPPYVIEPEHQIHADEIRDCIPNRPQWGNQLFYLRFKRPDLLPEHQMRFLGSAVMDANTESIGIDTLFWELNQEANSPKCGMIYFIDNNLQIQSISLHSQTMDYLKQLSPTEGELTPSELNDLCSELIYRWNNGKWIPLETAY